MTTIRDLLVSAKRSLRNASVSEPDLSAELLLSFVLQCERAVLFRDSKKEVTDPAVRAFHKLLERRKEAWPVAYLVEEQEFYGDAYLVNPSVLIPRPETERLVDYALDLLKNVSGRPQILDVGTGSGCVGISLAKRDPRLRVYALDRSLPALRVASKNAAKLGVADRVRFLASDLLRSISEGLHFDMIVSNPPYVCREDYAGLDPEIRLYEPEEALMTPPGDTAYYYREIAYQAVSRLKENGYLCFELGWRLADQVADSIRVRGFDSIKVHRDYSDVERVITAQIL